MNLSVTWKLLPTVFDVEKLKVEIEKKREMSLAPEVYTNPSLASAINKDLKVMTDKVENLDSLQKRVSDMSDYIESVFSCIITLLYTLANIKSFVI